MSRFAASLRPRFVGSPEPQTRPLVSRLESRRFAMLRRAEEALAVLPEDGQAVHCLMTGFYDLMHVLVRLIERLGPCQELRIATLSYNARNLAEMLALLDNARVARLTLLCSSFFRDHNKELWQHTRQSFHERGQRTAAARSHCKVVTLAFTSGQRLVLEGSANLRTNRNREQLTLVADDSVYQWHSTWIDDMVKAHEGDETTDGTPG